MEPKLTPSPADIIRAQCALAIRPLDIIVACECSGRVRDELRDMGHNAWSCDVLGPESTTEDHGLTTEDWAEQWRVQRYPQFHIVADARWAIAAGPPNLQHLLVEQMRRWDVVIGHPPCTRLTNAGARWLYVGGKGSRRNTAMWCAMLDAASFYVDLWLSDARVVTLENPVMHKHAVRAIREELARRMAVQGHNRVPERLRHRAKMPKRQYLQPYMFGDPFTKATGFLTDGRPPVPVPPRETWSVKREPAVHRESPGADRWYWRSLTYPTIARALAWHFGGKIRGRSDR